MKNYRKRVTTGVYLIKDNEILFLVRNKKNDTVHTKGMYLPIGGHVEFREDIATAAKREVLEESGIIVHTITNIGVVNIRGQQEEHDMQIYLFKSSDFTGEPVEGREGHFTWVKIDKLPTINIYEGDKIFLQYMLENKFFVIDFLFDGNKLLEHKVLTLINNKQDAKLQSDKVSKE